MINYVWLILGLASLGLIAGVLHKPRKVADQLPKRGTKLRYLPSTKERLCDD